ncbi:MAG: hypothetical protein IT371_20990 [Deltaproteobacteria bacterium]|nr:hypothetical protein [Deltaproteobacteria bacterium]
MRRTIPPRTARCHDDRGRPIFAPLPLCTPRPSGKTLLMRRLLGSWLLGGAWALLLAGCSLPPAQAPCADVDCSGHGVCVTYEDGPRKVPTCRCDAGYLPSASGWLCLPQNDTSLCAGVTCSGHGRCTSRRGRAACTCDTGYRTSDDGRSCLDGCAGVSCSGRGVCALDEGLPRCGCDAGYRTSADGLACERGPGTSLTYALYWEDNSDWSIGRATVDFTPGPRDPVETASYGVHLDQGGRGLTEETRLDLHLTTDGSEVRAFELDQTLTQGNVARRRFAEGTLAPGRATLRHQRAGATFVRELALPQGARPLLAPGLGEYPGWVVGPLSPTFYALLRARYDANRGGEQWIDALSPESGARIPVAVHAVGTPAADGGPALLELPDLHVRAHFREAYPERVVFYQAELTLGRVEGVPVDLNRSARPAAVAWPEPPELPKAAEQTVVVPVEDGAALEGTLTLPPSRTGPLRAVLFVADASAHDRDAPARRLPHAALHRQLALELAQAGIASLRYEARLSRPDARAQFVGLDSLTADAEAAFATLRAMKDVDPKRVYVASFGWASLEALTLLGRGHQVAGYVGLAPILARADLVVVHSATRWLKAAGFSDRFLDRQRASTLDELYRLRQRSYRAPRYDGDPVELWRDRLRFNGLPTLVGFAGPVLLLRGDKDQDTPPSQLTWAEQAASGAGKSNLKTRTLPGLTHVFGTESAEDPLWERAHFPYRVAPALVSQLRTFFETP